MSEILQVGVDYINLNFSELYFFYYKTIYVATDKKTKSVVNENEIPNKKN